MPCSNLLQSCKCLCWDHASSLAYENITLSSWLPPKQELTWLQLLSRSTYRCRLATVCSIFKWYYRLQVVCRVYENFVWRIFTWPYIFRRNTGKPIWSCITTWDLLIYLLSYRLNKYEMWYWSRIQPILFGTRQCMRQACGIYYMQLFEKGVLHAKRKNRFLDVVPVYEWREVHGSIHFGFVSRRPNMSPGVGCASSLGR